MTVHPFCSIPHYEKKLKSADSKESPSSIAEFAYKDCTENGTWWLHPHTGRPFAFYESCRNLNSSDEVKGYIASRFVILAKILIWRYYDYISMLRSYFTFSIFETTFLWRITDEDGSFPEMSIWSILLIKSDFKWRIHLRIFSFDILYV